MGNIKHNDELLRIHDDGFDVVFNCDNKHQNGVSYHAEKNGKKTKIDPEYAMAALVKKVSDGGGVGPTDDVLENAKETGGIGWTESEEVTIVDNESITTFPEVSCAFSNFETPFYIADGAYTVIFNGTEYNLNSAFYEEFGFWYLGDLSEDGVPDFSRYPFIIEKEDRFAAGLTTEFPGDYEVTIKMQPETIHKIDEKYLPESGGIDGIVIVNGNSDPETGELTIDKTFDELTQIYAQTNDIVMLKVGRELCECIGAAASRIVFSKFIIVGVNGAEAFAESNIITLHKDNTVTYEFTDFSFGITPQN